MPQHHPKPSTLRDEAWFTEAVRGSGERDWSRAHQLALPPEALGKQALEQSYRVSPTPPRGPQAPGSPTAPGPPAPLACRSYSWAEGTRPMRAPGPPQGESLGGFRGPRESRKGHLTTGWGLRRGQELT